jgi:hypothetical protein
MVWYKPLARLSFFALRASSSSRFFSFRSFSLSVRSASAIAFFICLGVTTTPLITFGASGSIAPVCVWSMIIVFFFFFIGIDSRDTVVITFFFKKKKAEISFCGLIRRKDR